MRAELSRPCQLTGMKQNQNLCQQCLPSLFICWFIFLFFKVEAWQDPGDLTWSVDIVGPSATGGNAPVAMLTWGPVVLGLVAVGGKCKIYQGQR